MLPLSPGPVVDLLRGDPSATALWTEEGTVSYGELGEQADDIRARLGTTRRLVMLEARNSVGTLAGYAAALAGGHPVLLVPGTPDEPAERTRAALSERFDPDVVIADGVVSERRAGSAHELHDDLALLMSTSGSTGSPKLVRISSSSLLANASSIAEYLRLTEADRAITSLPLHYCYGLSVVNSHLLTGGGLVLSDLSVSDDAFWAQAEAARITGFAGVPYTFDLLDAVGGTDRLPSSIRYVTQAGGRLPADRVRSLALAGRRRGFDVITMYGQTEATARMSYLPPEDAIRAAGSIGRAIPGGSFRIDAPEGTDTGELVYSGPNVMLGYADTPADLAAGRTVHELRTGDLARWRDDGYVEIVGRMNRFVKIFGLRIDLDEVQRQLEAEGVAARTAADDEELLIFVRNGRDADAAQLSVARRLGIPATTLSVHVIDAFPVTASGKPDNAALVAHHRALRATQTTAAPSAASAESIRRLLAVCTGRPDATPDDSFASLGGDSLSYVEASVRLEEAVGTLPRDWPSLSARRLAALAVGASDTADPARAPVSAQRSSSKSGRVLETSVVLRAIAIVLIVGTHADLFVFDGFSLQGGAHVLLVVAGYNLARFALSPAGVSRPRRLLGSALQIVLPAVLWLGTVALIDGRYAWTTALLVNNAVPSDGRWNEQWSFWFLEAIVWTMLALALAFAVPLLDRAERSAPWASALVVLGAALTVRFALVGFDVSSPLARYAVPTVAWAIALGWVIARADSTRRRIVASVLTLALVPGFFGEPLREAIVAAGTLALVWIPAIRVPFAGLRPVLTTLASASLYIYLTHWLVYPMFEKTAPLAGTLLSLIVGVAAWALYRASSRVVTAATRVLTARRDTAPRLLRSGG